MNKVSVIRRISQLVPVGLITFVGIRHQVVGGGPNGAAPLDSYCPFGGIETMYYYLQTGQFLQKTALSNMILLAAVIVLAIAAGSAFCSWLCPFGAVQEWLAGLGRKVVGRNYELPERVHRILKHMRFLVLFLIVFLTIRGSRMVFEDYDPFKVMFHFKFETTTAIIILVATVILSVLIDRFWCKYLCPLGAVFSILGRFSLINIRRNQDKCINCGFCSTKCPVKIDVANETKMPGSDCTRCLDCVQSCPKDEVLTVTMGGGK